MAPTTAMHLWPIFKVELATIKPIMRSADAPKYHSISRKPSKSIITQKILGGFLMPIDPIGCKAVSENH
jgi:hypothetical protein